MISTFFTDFRSYQSPWSHGTHAPYIITTYLVRNYVKFKTSRFSVRFSENFSNMKSARNKRRKAREIKGELIEVVLPIPLTIWSNIGTVFYIIWVYALKGICSSLASLAQRNKLSIHASMIKIYERQIMQNM